MTAAKKCIIVVFGGILAAEPVFHHSLLLLEFFLQRLLDRDDLRWQLADWANLTKSTGSAAAQLLLLLLTLSAGVNARSEKRIIGVR